MGGGSVEDHKMRYTAMFCDGESKSFDAIVEQKVYGDNVDIVKEDCVNHVSKRMGTALKRLGCRIYSSRAIYLRKG